MICYKSSKRHWWPHNVVTSLKRKDKLKKMKNKNGHADDLNTSTQSIKVLITRNLTTIEDKNAQRSIYAGVVSIDQIIYINTNDNVRGYLAETGKPTKVHRDIKESLKNSASDFHVLNGGLTIVAEDSTWDESNRQLILVNPSVINGAQTQGVIKEFLQERAERLNHDKEQELSALPCINFQLIVTKDKSLVADISIARNSQNSVKAISIAGGRGQLDDLSNVMKTAGFMIQTSEDEDIKSGNYLPSEKLLQVILALAPDNIKIPGRTSKDNGKTYCYSQKSSCLTAFSNAFENKDNNSEAKEFYDYCLGISIQAWNLYCKWQKHPGFKGTGLRAIERNKSGEIIEVPDGIIFPIIAAHAAFISKKNGNWTITIPNKADKLLIDNAKNDYIDVAASNPQTMGKSKACYSRLRSFADLIANS